MKLIDLDSSYLPLTRRLTVTVAETSEYPGAKTLTTVSMEAVSMATGIVRVILPSELIFMIAATFTTITAQATKGIALYEFVL